MDKEEKSRFTSNIEVCSGWAEVTKAFQQLPKPTLRREESGETYLEEWIYRGHKEAFPLKPSIEREPCDWAEMEYRLLREFQSKAPMHLEASQLPPTDCKLSWLAIMQHYGVPTRLLDFTYSPYVALYFALRHRKKEHMTSVEVWGIDAAAVRQRAESILLAADDEVRKQREVPTDLDRRFGGRLKDFSSALQDAQEDVGFWNAAMRNALNPCGIRRERFNHTGLVTVALPPVQNLRLSCQQGVFLFNGAEDRSFEVSLEFMMRGRGDSWYRRFTIPKEDLHAIEEQLFQMNIHDLSLFPDAEGLAGFARQRMRLHWRGK